MKMIFLKNLLVGKSLRAKMADGDIEYQRKATILIILNYLAIVMLTMFTCLAIAQGSHFQAYANGSVFLLVLLGFILMRRRGNLTIGAYIIIVLLCLKFLLDFGTDTNRAMWSFTIPVVSFFIIGIRGGIVCISVYWTLLVLAMKFTAAADFSMDFKIRFIAIYFCVTLFAYFLEKVRQQTQGLLHELSSRNDAILAAVPDIIMQVDNNKIYTWANKAGREFFGDDVIGKEARYFFEGAQDTYLKTDPLFSGNEEVIYVESWQRRKDGTKRLLAWWCRVLKDTGGTVIGALSSARDITENRAIEDQFSQTQKMDAIGQLAGGIAHDFNNQLSIITGFAELIRNKTTGNEMLSRYADNILQTARRSADLTGQLLAFSRKGKYRSIPVDVHRIVAEVVNILIHTIDKRITIRQQFKAGTAVTTGDPTQIQNAFLNLALNARDAMPDGGNLTFATELTTLDRSYHDMKKYVISPGQYIIVSITDSGMGMDAETRSHLFEPFFTTKEKGKGTGMGLPAVYGIVKNHKGAIHVYSEPGRGTTIKIYLPAAGIEARDDQAEVPKMPAMNSKLNILFVDDEQMMREMAKEMLQGFGHTVLLCDNGQAAVDRYKESWKSIDLVILDIIMPVMGGRAAFTALRRINPKVKVILSSGYSMNDEAQQIIDEGALEFVQKPFNSSQIAEAIYHAMGEK
jgi:two-component system cell cycle sensor histidine kinase/response regulator CckA